MPYSLAAREDARVFLRLARAMTVCAKCGAQPVDFHHESHEQDSNRRVAHLAALGFPLSVIAQEIARCEALCRRCHMNGDGRMKALHKAHRAWRDSCADRDEGGGY